MLVKFPLRPQYFQGGSHITSGTHLYGVVEDSLQELLDSLGSRPDITEVADDQTVQLADELDVILVDVAAAGGTLTLTLPDNMPPGFAVKFVQSTAGTVTFAPDTDVVMNSFGGAASMAGQWSIATAEVIGLTDVTEHSVWLLAGQLV